MAWKKMMTVASLLVFSAGVVVAQQRDGNQPADKKTEKSETNAPQNPQPATGAVKDETPTDPKASKETGIKQLDKEGRGGQQK